MTRPQKITLGEMRSSGVRGLLIYCADYKCSHRIGISADQWADDIRLSDLEDKFTCTACGTRGAEGETGARPRRGKKAGPCSCLAHDAQRDGPVHAPASS